MKVHLFDDHSDALLHWHQAGYRDLICVHVDAHLDVMEECFDETALRAFQGAPDLDEFRKREGPFGSLLHCANYLYPALVTGVVGKLIWVVPERLWKAQQPLTTAFQLLDHWVDLPLSDLGDWREEEGAMKGTLFGRPFCLCSSQTFPSLTLEESRNLALDIDLDYFVNLESDRVWQSPQQLKEELGNPQAKILTVASSVEGGYTPVRELFLGELCTDVFRGEELLWEFARELLEIDSLPSGERHSLWEDLLERVPAQLHAALLWRLGREEEAGGLDARYSFNPLDLVARSLEKKHWSEALQSLRDLPRNPEVLELSLYAHQGQRDWEAVCHCFQALEPTLVSGPSSVKIFQLAAGAYLRSSQPGLAEAVLRRAVELAPGSAALYLDLGQARVETGRKKPAIRAFQKAIRLSRGRWSSLAILKAARCGFRRMGEDALATSTERERKRVTRHLKSLPLFRQEFTTISELFGPNFLA